MRFSLPGAAGVLALAVALAGAGRAQARAPRAADKAKSTTSRKAPVKGKEGMKGKAAAKPAVDPKAAAETLPPPKGKLAVFAFSGDGASPIYKEILHIFQAKGLKVQTSIRPMDSAEQYRELAQTLDLIAFIDGETEVDGAQGSATIHVRNGVSGLRVASATFCGDKRKLPGELARGLWDQLSPALSQATVDAAGPRRHDRAPMRIEAGTPLTNAPPEEAENRVSAPAKVGNP